MVIREREFFTCYYKSFPAFINLFDFFNSFFGLKAKTKQNTNLKITYYEKIIIYGNYGNRFIIRIMYC